MWRSAEETDRNGNKKVDKKEKKKDAEAPVEEENPIADAEPEAPAGSDDT